MKASVIIPTYNRMELLFKTLSSFVVCNPEVSAYEIIITDDGSKDDTLNLVVKKFEKLLNLKYVYMRDDGFRLSRARNLGASLAEGDICIFCDSGILACTDFVRSHIEEHTCHANAYVIGSVYGIYAEDDMLIRLDQMLSQEISSNLLEEVRANSDFADPREEVYLRWGNDLSQMVAPWALAWGANISVKRQVWNDLGGFDENYVGWGAEDLDFALNAYNNGAEFRLCRDAGVVHIPHGWNDGAKLSEAQNLKYMHSKYNIRQTELLLGMDTIPLNLLEKSAI